MSGWIMVLFLLALVAIAFGQEGWKMTDRFHGFRYEITGSNLDIAVARAIQSQADSYSCFGWVQLTESGSLVGEGRCSKIKGKSFQEWIEKLQNVNVHTLVSEEDDNLLLMLL